MTNSQKVNQQIQAKEGLVIDIEGNALGKMALQEAFAVAEQQDADLVQVNENPPVFRVMKYEKFLYELKKKQKSAHKPKHSNVVKEIQFMPQIGKHDVEIKIKKVQELLDDGYKVKIIMRIPNRRAAFREIGVKLINDVYERLTGLQANNGVLTDSGNVIYAILVPTHNKHEKELRGNKTDTSQENERNEPIRAI
jgi:translation initiation factor IF-3